MTAPTWPQLIDRFAFRLSLVAEEIGDDFAHVLAVAMELGLGDLEFGTLWGKAIDVVSQRELAEARDLLDRHEIKVCAVSAGTFKTVLLGEVPVERIEDDPHFREHMRLLQAQLAAARHFGAPLARVFSFRREDMVGLGNPSPRPAGGGVFPEEIQTKVAHALGLACRAAEDAGVVLGMENVRSCWGDSGHNASLILEQVGSPWLRAIWDPANAFVSGEQEAFPEGHAAVESYVAHVHLKDAVVLDEVSGLTQWERIGDGAVDLAGQLAALNTGGYTGCASIETHWRPPGGDPESNTRGTYAGLRAILETL